MITEIFSPTNSKLRHLVVYKIMDANTVKELLTWVHMNDYSEHFTHTLKSESHFMP